MIGTVLAIALLLTSAEDPDVEAGKALFEKRDFPAARARFEKAIARDPLNHLAIYGRGLVRAELGEYDQAIEDLTKVVELAPDFPDAYRNRGSVHHLKEDLQAAQSDLNHAIELDPGDDWSFYTRASIHVDLKSFDSALNDADQAIAINPAEPVYHGARGVALFHLHRPRDAADELTKYIESGSGDAEDYVMRSACYLAIGEARKALADSEEAIGKDRGSMRAHAARANSLLALGLKTLALEEAENLIRIQPSYGEAYAMKGSILSSQGEFKAAVKELSRAIELEPDQPRVWAIRGEANLKQGNYPAAVVDLTRVSELDPSDLDARVFLGVALARSGRTEEGLRELEEVCKQDPNHVAARLFRGEFLRPKSIKADAIAAMSQAIAINPNDEENLVLRALTYCVSGQLDLAIADFLSLRRLRQARFEHVLRELKADAQISAEIVEARLASAIQSFPRQRALYWRRAVFYARAGRLREAAWDMGVAAALPPAVSEFCQFGDLVRAHAGLQFGNRSDYQNLPGHDDPDFLAGKAALDGGDSQSAIERFDRLLTRDPKSVLALTGRACALLLRKQNEEAITLLSQVIALEPHYYTAFRNRAVAHWSKGRHAEALRDVNRAIELAPSDALNYEVRAMLQMEAGRPDEAKRDADRAVEFEPDDPRFLLLRGRVFLELDLPRNAAQDLSQCIERGGGVTAYCIRAKAYGKLGELRKAYDDCEAAFRLQPESDDVYCARAQLQYNLWLLPLALEDFKHVEEKFSDISSVQAWIANAHNFNRDFAVAKSNLTAAIERFPDDLNLRALRALSCIGLKNYKDALNDLDVMIRSGRAPKQIYVNRAYVLLQLNRSEEAHKDLDHVTMQDPNFSDAWTVRGMVYLKAGDHRQAILAYSDALILSPTDWRNIVGRATVYASCGRIEEATRDILIVADTRQKVLESTLKATKEQVAMGLNEVVICGLTSNLQAGPLESRLYWLRANAYLKTGELKAAVADICLAAALYPLNSLCVRVYESITGPFKSPIQIVVTSLPFGEEGNERLAAMSAPSNSLLVGRFAFPQGAKATTSASRPMDSVD